MNKKLSVFLVLVMLFSIVGLPGMTLAAAEEGENSNRMNVQLEELDRGLVAAMTAEGVFLSWRLMTDEVTAYSDYGLRGADFHVYRDGTYLATVDKSTNYLDPDGTLTSEYYVSAVVDGIEVDQSAPVTPWEQGYVDVPLQKPESGVTPAGETYDYHANDMSVGDVNGDGQYEFIVKWEPTNAKDVSQRGYTGKTYIDTYTLDGTLMHRIDLGVNIRSGAHYTQFLVYDFDGDGKAELMFKTAPGTKVLKYDDAGNVVYEQYITMPQADIDAGYSHTDDYRLSSEDYYNHLVEMFMGWQEHPEVALGNWPATIEEALDAADEMAFEYPLSRDDAEILADYFIDVYAKNRSGNNDLRNFEGFILTGPEYLTVFDGETGGELQTIHYKPERGDDGLMWGDYAMSRIEPGNRVDRFLAGVAYLDGEKPSAIFARGYYTRSTIVAYDWDGTSLQEVWFVDSGHAPMTNPFDDGPHGRPGSNPEFAMLTTQGFHSMSAADVDGDGKHEIVYGSATIDHDGTLLYSSTDIMPDGSGNPGAEAGLGHGDAMHVADIDPDRPGLEIFTVHEGGPWAPYGYALRDAATGEVIYGGYTGRDTGRGMIGDVVRGQRGLETWAVGLWTAQGGKISDTAPGTNMSIRWAADMTTQIVSGSLDQTPTIEDWERGTLLTAEGTRTNNHTKGNPSLVADVFGDWREELLVRTEDSSAIRIYLSTELTNRKMYTLMHDIQYRAEIARQNTAYNQPAYPGFYFGMDIDWSKVTVPNAGELTYIEEDPPELDKTPLQALIDEAKGLASDGGARYTEASYQALLEAIAEAEAAILTVTTEYELYTAIADLQAAVDGLEEIPVELPGWRFDFGSADSPIADGYTQVTNSSLYDPDIGYGISKEVAVRDRGAPDDVRRDFIIDSDYEFMFDLPNGSYSVRIIAGDDIAFNRSGFTIEGTDHGTISSNAGEYAELTVMTEVRDEQLTIHIRDNGRINGLEIVPMSPITSLAAEDVNLSANPSVTLAWEPDPIASNYRVYRKAEDEDAFSLIGISHEPSFTDETVRLGFTYTYAVTLVAAGDMESAFSNEVNVTMTDDTVQPPKPPFRLKLAQAGEHSVSFEWKGSADALLYYVFRSRFSDGTYDLVGVTDEPAYTDDDITTSSHYYYKVYAVNTGGISEASEVFESPIKLVYLRQMEKLDRGLVAIETEQGIYVGWRLFGTDPERVSFDLYRDGKKINGQPIRHSTNYLDTEGTIDSTYQVKVHGRKGAEESKTVGVWSEQYWSIPLDKPEDGVTVTGDVYTYAANDASVGDLDGDGEYEIVLKWEPSNAQDNSRSGYTGNVYYDAYDMDGTKLWRIDSGINIRGGAHYNQFLVYDFDGNGKSEFIMKTADGTVDGTGTVIGDVYADWRNDSGFILEGPEYLTIFDGETGEAVDTVDYDPPRGNVNDWGDNYGNRADRFLAGVAYLDGEKPSIVMARGYYTRAVLVAYDYIDGKLVKRWVFDSDDPGNRPFVGQGNHNLSVADVDGDGFDEIVYGAAVIDHDGTGLYATGLGHGDALHVSDFDPHRPGLEIYQPHESGGAPYGYELRDAETGEILWGEYVGADVGRALAADIDPRHPGAEMWASNSWDGSSGVSALHTVRGEVIAEQAPRSINHAVWWDGDLLRELLDHDFDQGTDPHGYPRIDKWDWEAGELEPIYTPDGVRSINYTKGNPSLQADLFGDWREEIIWPSSDSTELQIHTTTHLTEHRIHTLMHDPVYRLGIAWQNIAYNQPPHTGFYLGDGMEEPPRPNIVTGDGQSVPGEPNVPELDFSELEELIEAAKAISNEDRTYTPNSYQALQRAIRRVEKAMLTIESEEQMQMAIAQLQEAVDGLERRRKGGGGRSSSDDPDLSAN